jgi:hypothetical protein
MFKRKRLGVSTQIPGNEGRKSFDFPEVNPLGPYRYLFEKTVSGRIKTVLDSTSRRRIMPSNKRKQE